MLLQGPRLRLRPWRAGDAAPLAALTADPAVMRHFPAPLGRAESDAFLARMMLHETRHGFGLRAVEGQDGSFMGLCGLARVGFAAHFTPAVEIAWRLAPAFWGQGLAAEAARLALGWGFGPLGLTEIVSFTAAANAPSWRLMQRLGMQPDGAFDHPRLAEGHPLRPHLLYRLGRAQWLAQGGTGAAG